MTLLASAMFSTPSHAGKCGGANIIEQMTSKLAWNCVFPIRIGGKVQMNVNAPEDPDSINRPDCVCMRGGVPYIGVRVTFWEPAKMIDTVTDPYCFMVTGTKMTNPSPGKLGGTYRNDATDRHTFAQFHSYIFPAWALLDMFRDLPCLAKNKFDIAMISEVLPTWNNDILSLIVNPEAILFGNPVTQLACIADAAAALKGMPIDQLFWCMGSWGGTYPLTGSIGGDDFVQANAGIAARSLFLMGRTGIMEDPGISYCGAQWARIWRKRNYRMQLVQPVSDSTCRQIGKSGLLWSQAKNPPNAGDNFEWMIFRKVKCCVTY